MGSSKIHLPSTVDVSKEVRVEIRLKNNRLIAMRERLGLCQRDAARAIGIVKLDSTGSGVLGELEGLRTAPLKPNGKWTASAIKIAKFYDVDPSWLFSQVITSVKNPMKVLEMRAAEVMALANHPLSDGNPEDALMFQDTKKAVQKTLANCLTPREERVLRLRFGFDDSSDGKTYKEIADDFQVGIERIRQIEQKALRKLRHPQKKKQILDACDSASLGG